MSREAGVVWFLENVLRKVGKIQCWDSGAVVDFWRRENSAANGLMARDSVRLTILCPVALKTITNGSVHASQLQWNVIELK